MSRYNNSRLINGGRALSTNNTIPTIRAARDNGFIKTRTIVIKEAQRLDQIAAINFGDGSLWWIIAAVSNIGWNLQVPPGTKITLPTNIQQVLVIAG